jgi:hypothetical protein
VSTPQTTDAMPYEPEEDQGRAFLEAVAKIVGYCWDDEEADFHDMCEADGEESQAGHIFVALSEARAYLVRTGFKA